MSNIYTNEGMHRPMLSKWCMLALMCVFSFFGLPVSAQDTIEVGDTYPITVITDMRGGKLTVDKQSAAPGETVTITTQADEGYYLNYLILADSSGEPRIYDCAWYTGKTTTTFVMPSSEVTVGAEFVLADGLAANMPSKGTREVSFPTKDAIINISGLPNGEITEPSYLHLTTGIAGMRIQLRTEGRSFLSSGDRFIIYDGADTTAHKLVDIQMPESEEEEIEAVSLGSIFSSGSDLIICMIPNNNGTFYSAIDMNASMFSSDAQYEITSVPADNGSIEVQSSAKVGEKVTIKVKPDDGFLLTGLYIYTARENGEGTIQLPHSEYTWYDGTNTLTFDMPASNVVIRPYFLGNFTGNDIQELYGLPVPASGSKEVNLAESVKAFVLTADKGANSSYSNNADGKLLLTASQNQRFVFNGKAQFADNVDKVTVYDGTTADDNVLFELSSSKPYVQDKVSSGNQVLISFKTNESGNLPQGFLVQVEMETIPTSNMKGTGTAEDPYLLEKSEDWDAFASLVNSGRQSDACARLDNVLEILLTASNKVGTMSHPYTGTFDGNGNVILFSSGEQPANEVAPFLYIDGATIKDLLTGSSRYELPTSQQSYVGGIACHTVGKKSTISRCAIGAQGMMILNGGTVGGLVADAGAPLDIEDCAVGPRAFLVANNKFGGMVGNATAEVTISNSLVTQLSMNGNPANNYVFCGTPDKVVFKNAFYYDCMNAVAQGTEIKSEDYAQLGKVLSMLQNGRTDAAYWMEDTRESILEPYSANLLKQLYTRDYFLYYDTNYKGYYANTLHLETYEGSITNHPIPLNPAIDINTDFVELDKRSISGSEENPSLYTVCVPFDIKSTDLEEMQYVKAYELSGVDKANKTLTFKQVTAMEAARPYIIEVTGKSHYLAIYARGAKVYSKEVEPVTVGDVTMTGNYSYMDWYDLNRENAYILQADDMWHPVPDEENSSVYLSTSRAYLTFANNTAAKAFSMKLSDGETTGITGIKTVDNDGTVRYFDLSGKYIGTSLEGAKSGMYINSNGKKVIK